METLEIANESIVLKTLTPSDIAEFIEYLKAEIDHTCTASAYGLERVKALENKITILKGLQCT